MKTEPPAAKRVESKRKIVTVPELSPERIELTKQSDEIEMEPMQMYLEANAIEQTSMELMEPIDQPILREDYIDMMPQTTAAGPIEILEHKLISNPLSFTMPKTSLLVLTTDGNYVITKLDDGVHKTNEIGSSPPQVKEIIILNSNNLQLPNIAMDYQTIQQNVDDNSRIRYRIQSRLAVKLAI